jgi:hypothetical protein
MGCQVNLQIDMESVSCVDINVVLRHSRGYKLGIMAENDIMVDVSDYE